MLGKFEDNKEVGNKKQKIEEGQTIQWTKRKRIKGQTMVYKAPLRKPYTEWHNRTPQKAKGELRCPGMVSSSFSTLLLWNQDINKTGCGFLSNKYICEGKNCNSEKANQKQHCSVLYSTMN